MLSDENNHMKDDPLSISRIAELLEVSRSSFYYKHKLPDKDEVLKYQIQEVLKEHPAYGHRRIAIELGINKKRVLRVMKKFNLFPTVWANNKKKRSNKPHLDSRIPNLAATLSPIQPNVIWSGDFTYLKYQGRFVYLATVIDIYSREIVAWQLGYCHTSKLVADVLESAIQRRERPPDIFHSDQGSEYTSKGFQDLLRKYTIQQSNAPKGKPWKNGRQESFYNTFKRELGNISRFQDIDYLFEAISSLIHYYNNKRIHGALKMSPKQYYDQNTYKNTQ